MWLNMDIVWNILIVAIVTLNSAKALSIPTINKPITVALTRELGSNYGISSFLADDQNIECLEIPCLKFQMLESSRQKLLDTMTNYDVILISSPHSGEVFSESWIEAGRPDIKVATVGRGTSMVLEQVGLETIFEPSDCTADCLAEQLPTSFGKRVLFPTSALAGDTLESGLASRGFEVTRIDTYSTISPILSIPQLQLGSHADIVAFASPSAVKTWSEQLGTDYTAVTIGPSSFHAAESLGFREVYTPQDDTGPISQGMEPWGRLIKKIAADIMSTPSENRNSVRGAKFWRK